MIILQGVFHLYLCLVIGQIAPHERAQAALLHELALAETGQLGKAVIAVDYGIVDYLSVRE